MSEVQAHAAELWESAKSRSGISQLDRNRLPTRWKSVRTDFDKLLGSKQATYAAQGEIPLSSLRR